MQSVAKFVTKGCIISGSAEVLKKVSEYGLDISDSSVTCINMNNLQRQYTTSSFYNHLSLNDFFCPGYKHNVPRHTLCKWIMTMVMSGVFMWELIYP